jgi:hypothetical protein
MRTLLTLLALVAVEVSPLIAHAEAATPKASVASHGGDLAGRLGYESTLPYAPSLTLELRAAAGHDDALLGPLPTYYRTQPEVLFGLRPVAHVSLFAGGGIGAAYVVPDATVRGVAMGPALTFSGALGARFPWERVPVTAVTRAETVTGGGTALTLNLALGLNEAR